jgi:hypothetical protein
MRKFLILIIALGVFGVLSGESWAAKVSIAGRHSQSEIQATCGAVGGSFFSNSHYGCTNECAGGTDTCAVECVNGKCTGSCPRCGARIASPNRARLGGADAVTRVLNNLTATRAGGPGYGYGPGPYPDAVIVNPVTGRWCRTESNGYQFCWTP